MPKTLICHYLPQFAFNRLRNGGIFVESGTVTSLNIGLRESHFLIHVEYLNTTTREVEIEVIHKKSVVEIKSFFRTRRNEHHQVLLQIRVRVCVVYEKRKGRFGC